MAAGRPRRFEAEDELRLLFDAAFSVMEQNGFQDMTVADILAKAGVSTRSFYRHFGSKDELLCAMYRREAESAAERLQTAVDKAGNPRQALETWIDAIVSIGHNRKKAARAAVLGSSSAARAEGYADETRHAAKLLCAPLEAILSEGARDGSFPAADPETDAPLIQAVTMAAAGLSPLHAGKWTRPHARDHVLSFCLRALGAES
jgi:AcrR family transcriptional regulator